MKFDRLCGLLCVGMLSSFASHSALGQNLLVNPGFETGNFNGWTLSGSTAFEGVSTSFASAPNSGSYSAFFGAVGAFNVISQTITTVVGDNYNISFALDNSGGPYSEMFVDWGGNQVFDIQPSGSFGWTEFGWNEVATGTSTTISFGFEQVPSYFNLDDTRVVDLDHRNTDNFPPQAIINTDVPGDRDQGPQKVPDQGSIWTAVPATLLGLCGFAANRRRQPAA